MQSNRVKWNIRLRLLNVTLLYVIFTKNINITTHKLNPINFVTCFSSVVSAMPHLQFILGISLSDVVKL